MSEITFTIQGHQFTIPLRYSAGHVLTEGEASALNQVFVENVRNNQGAKIKAALEAGEFDLADWRDKVFDYASAYNFGVRAVSTPKDPVMTRARKLVVAALKAKLVAGGYDIKGMKDRIEATADNVLANPEKAQKFIDEAKRLLEIEQNAADLDLGDL